MKKSNPYYVFLENLLIDLRITANGFQEKYDVRSFSTIMNKLKNNPKKKLHPETKGKIEDALKIKINDSNPEDITYNKIATANPTAETDIPLNKYPLISKVYGGDSLAMFVNENISDYIPFPYYKKERCFVVRVSGNSMNHKIEEGDLVLVDMDKEIINGCIVIARLNDGKQIIKRYRELPNGISMFYSDNGGFEPLTMQSDEIEAIYRVVSIYKQV